MKKILITTMLVLAVGASSATAGPRVDGSDAITGIGAVIGAVIGLAFGLPPVGIIGATAVGAGGGAAVYKEPDEVVDLSLIPEEERASVAKAEFWTDFLSASWKWLIGGFLAWTALPLVIGYFLPNGKQRKQKVEMIKIKEMLFDNPDISIKDLK